MIRLAIFDLAGTLIEDHNEVSGSFLLALRNNGLQVTDDDINEWKGSSKREAIGHFVARQFGSCYYVSGQARQEEVNCGRFAAEPTLLCVLESTVCPTARTCLGVLRH